MPWGVRAFLRRRHEAYAATGRHEALELPALALSRTTRRSCMHLTLRTGFDSRSEFGIEQRPDIRFDRCHFASFAEDSLEFQAVYYVLSADFNHHMDLQQQIHFSILEAFERIGVAFAGPARRVWLAAPPRGGDSRV